MLRECTATPNGSHSTPTPRTAAQPHPLRTASSLNPVRNKPAFLPTATFHRFRKLGHLLQPSPAAVWPRRELDTPRPDSPPLSPPPALAQPSQGKQDSLKDHGALSQAVPPPTQPTDELSAVRSTSRLHRSVAVQTSFESPPPPPRPRAVPLAPPVVDSSIAKLPQPPRSSPAAQSAPAPRSAWSPSSPALRAVHPHPRVSPKDAHEPPPPVREPHKPEPNPTLPRFTTAYLAPFQRHLGAARDVHVELLADGQLVLDLRRGVAEGKKARESYGAVYLFSGDGDEMSVFHPPLQHYPASPLVLHHPTATYSHAALASLACAASRATPVQRRHVKAYRTAARLIAALKARVPLLSFYHHRSPSSPVDLPAPRIKVTLFVDVDSYACAAAPGDSGPREVVTAVVHHKTGEVLLTLPSAGSTITTTTTLTLTLILPLTLPPSVPRFAASLARFATARDTRALVQRVAEAHVAALAPSGGGAPNREGVQSDEARAVGALRRALRGVGGPDLRTGAGQEGQGRDGDINGDGGARYLPGLGWALRVPVPVLAPLAPPPASDSAVGADAEWRLLLADGGEVHVRLCAARAREDVEAGGREEKGERVELRWDGGRYVPGEDPLPTRLLRRLPLVIELLGLFLHPPS